MYVNMHKVESLKKTKKQKKAFTKPVSLIV